MKKCIHLHLHIHSNAHSMLIAITYNPLAIISQTCESRSNWAYESMQREIWKDSASYKEQIWNISVSISLVFSFPPLSPPGASYEPPLQKHAELLKQSQRISIALHKQKLYPWPSGACGIMTDSIWHGFSCRKYQRNKGGGWHRSTGGTGVCEKQQDEHNDTRIGGAINCNQTQNVCLIRMKSQILLCEGMKEISSIDSISITSEWPNPNFLWIITIVIWFSYGCKIEM